MIQIRTGIFETNSSSTHAISVANYNPNNDVTKKLTFDFGSFGWEQDTHSDPYTKAAYLHTAMCLHCSSYDYDTDTSSFDYKKYDKYCHKIREVLSGVGCEVEFKKWDDDAWYYIDHSNELGESFVEGIVNNPTRLLSFLFDYDSVIVTGNDNMEEDVTIPHASEKNQEWYYYKGN